MEEDGEEQAFATRVSGCMLASGLEGEGEEEEAEEKEEEDLGSDMPRLVMIWAISPGTSSPLWVPGCVSRRVSSRFA